MNRKALLLSAILCVALATPVFAQTAETEYELGNVLQKHPDLASNPSLLFNPQWRQQHPNVVNWFDKHPGATRQARESGAWETNGAWHDPNWWQQNNPNWVYQNHPEWVQRYPVWRERGDWDEHNEWHDRDWYLKNRREWAEKRHPEWAKEGPPYGHALGHYKHKHKEKNEREDDRSRGD